MRFIRPERVISTRNDGKRRSTRRLRGANTLEVLEGRVLLAGDTSAAVSAWHNSAYPLDVNFDDQITPRDALLIINDLLINGSHSIATQAGSTSSAAASAPAPSGALDVNADGKVTPADVISVVNQLAAPIPNLKAEYSLEAEDLNGNPISTVPVNQDFQLAMFIQDKRNPAATHGGAFAGFANVTYNNASNPLDTSLVTTSATTVDHGDPSAAPPNNQMVIHGTTISPGFFTLTESSDLSTAGQINRAGGAAQSLQAPGAILQPVWTVRMHAANAGTENFTTSFDGSAGHDTLLYDLNTAVPANQIQFDSTSLLITSAPTVTSITLADANPTKGGTLHYTVTFSKSVTGVDATDFTLTPSAGVTGGPFTPVVSGGPTVYTVTASNVGGDGTLQLNLLNDGSIKDTVSQATLIGPFPTATYTIDNTAPLFTSFALPDSNPTNAGTVHFTVNFNEPVTNVTAGDFTLVPTGVTGASIANVSAIGNGQSYSVTVNTGSNNGSLALQLTSAGTIADLAGNPLGGALPPASAAYTIDKTAPTVVLPIGLTDPTTNNLSTVHFTVNFSENVTGVSTASFNVVAGGGITGASISNVSGSGSSYTVTVNTGSGDGTLALQIPNATAIKDLAGNALSGTPVTSSLYTIDRPPSVTAINRVEASPTHSGTVHFSVTFSKSVTGVDTAGFTNFSLVQSGVTGAAITSISGSGSSYTVTVNTGSGDGTLALKLDNAGAIMDSENQALTGLPFTGQTYVIDKTAPTVTSFTATDPSPTSAAVVHFAVTFSENVTGVATFSNFALITSGGVTGAAITNIAGSGMSYTVTVNTGTGTTTGTLSLAIPNAGTIVDTAGNPLAPPTGGTFPITSTTSYTINHNANQKASIRLELSKDGQDPSDPNSIIKATDPPLNPGDHFVLDVFVQDTRSAGVATGIFAAYLNAMYDSSLVSVNGPISYGMNNLGTPNHTGGANFTTAQAGDTTTTPGLIANAGATTGSPLASFPTDPTDAELLFSIPMVANSIGLATFTPFADMQLGHDVLEYGSNQSIPATAIDFESTQIFIGSNVFALTGATPGASPNVAQAEGNPGDINNGLTPFVFNVSWFMPDPSIPVGATATVQYSTVDGTAMSGAAPGDDNDYVAASGTLTFTQGGPTTLPITVTVNGDTTDEPDENFSVMLTSISGQPQASSAPAIGTIVNDDAPVQIIVSDAQPVPEGGLSVFTVSLSAASGKTVTVAYHTKDGSAVSTKVTGPPGDYTPIPAPAPAATFLTLTFNPGDPLSQTVTVTTLQDAVLEGPETFQLKLTSPGNATLAASSPSAQPGLGTATIIDVPPATLSGLVYIDGNNDGIREPSEVGIGNVKITATNQLTNTSQSVLTQADGTYMFVGLLPGVPYTISETQPGFFSDGKDLDPRPDAASKVNDKNDLFADVTLASSEQAGGFYFGEVSVRPEFALALFNRRAFDATALFGGGVGAPTTPLNLQGGDVWISFDGGWQGPGTITASVANAAAGSVSMTLYDNSLNPIALSTPTVSGGAVLQYNGASATYFLRISGTNTSVSLTTNFATTVNPTYNSSVTGNGSSVSAAAPPSGAASTNTSSPAATPATQPAGDSDDESEDATDAAMADEDDWVTEPLTV